MRMALVEVLGHLIRELAASLDAEDNAGKAAPLKQINGLYDLLLGRALDQSSYVRAKVFNVMARLCDSPTTGAEPSQGGPGTSSQAKFPQQRLLMTRVAVDSLEDKTSSVRKASITLLVRLILTHPYGVYGGFLSEAEWRVKYQEVADLLAKMEGEIGKAVERNEEEGSQAGEDEAEEDEDDEDGEDEDGEGRKKKRRKS